MSEISVLIASTVSLCDRATIDMGDGMSKAVGSIIIMSLKYMDRKLLLEKVHPGAYIDWDYIEDSTNLIGNKQNLLGDTDMWLQLLPYLDFGKLTCEVQEQPLPTKP
jgi:hypothetical protein